MMKFEIVTDYIKVEMVNGVAKHRLISAESQLNEIAANTKIKIIKYSTSTLGDDIIHSILVGYKEL